MTARGWHEAGSPRRSALAAGVTLAGIVLVGVLVFDDHARTAWLVVLGTVLLAGWLVSRPMELVLDVGDQEQHRVVLRFDRFWGKLSVAVDGSPVVQGRHMASARLRKAYDFSVGTAEPHRVRIEKDRSLVFAGFRGQPVRAYVDGVLSAEGTT